MKALWRKTSGWKLPVLGAVGLVFALVSVLGRAEEPAKEPVTEPPVSVYENNIAGIGVIEPKSELITIGTELPGVVREIHVKVGQQVAKGDALFSLDQREIDAQIEVLKAALVSARVQVAEANAQFALVKNVSDKRAIARDDYNRRHYAAKLAVSRISEIEAQLQQAQTTKARLTVIAPIDGTILDLNVRPGEFAASGAVAEPLIRMGDVTTLHVRVEFDEEQAVRLSRDAPAIAYKRGDTSNTYPLSFVRLEPYVTPKENLAVAGQRVDTRVLEVIYALPESSRDSLLTGQQMDVFVREDIKSGAL
jgi:HlyD family secretion protein